MVSDEEARVEKPNYIPLILSIVATVVSLASFALAVIQYQAQNKSEIWGTCALSKDAAAHLEVLPVNSGSIYAHKLYTLMASTTCILLNNGQKSTSIVRVNGTSLSDGHPISREAIKDLALIKNSLVDKSMLPISLPPGESKTFNVWLPIDLGDLPLRIEALCVENQKTFKTVFDFDKCFSSHGFDIAIYLYGDPPPLNGLFNGVGITFISNENKAITFEINIQHAIMYAAADNEHNQIRTDYSLALERGNVEELSNNPF